MLTIYIHRDVRKQERGTGWQRPSTQTAGPERKLKVLATLLPPPHATTTSQHSPGEMCNYKLERPARWGVRFQSVTTAFTKDNFKRPGHHRDGLIVLQPTAVCQPPALSQQERESKILKQ